MRYILLYVLLLFSVSVKSQEPVNFDLDYLKKIASSEEKYSVNKLAFKANPSTANYDISYHRLYWEVDPTKAQIKGEVTTYFTALENLNQVVFDLAGNMQVSEIKQRGKSLNFDQNNDDELVINLSETQNKNTLDSLTIFYGGNPVSSGFGSFEINTHGASNAPVLWTLSEPYGAKGWWPCKQDLTDKIDSIDVIIKHPRQYKAASNGLLISETISKPPLKSSLSLSPLQPRIIEVVNKCPTQALEYVYNKDLSEAELGETIVRLGDGGAQEWLHTHP